MECRNMRPHEFALLLCQFNCPEKRRFNGTIDEPFNLWNQVVSDAISRHFPIRICNVLAAFQMKRCSEFTKLFFADLEEGTKENQLLVTYQCNRFRLDGGVLKRACSAEEVKEKCLDLIVRVMRKKERGRFELLS